MIPMITPAGVGVRREVIFKDRSDSLPRVPAIGIVMIQEKSNKRTLCQFTALHVPLQRPTPIVAPVMHIEVETGSAY